MKSIRYILTGQPTTLEDCLHMGGGAGGQVVLSLDVERSLWEQDDCLVLVARLDWLLGDRSAQTRHVCGSMRRLADASIDHALAVERANLKLDELLARLSSAGIAAAGAQERFAPEMLAAAECK